MKSKNGYSYTKQWFDFLKETQEIVTPMHTSLYFWIVELNNSLKWCEVFGLPTDRAMEMARIKSYKYYKKTLDDLIKFGFVELKAKSYNQYTCNQIALVLTTKAVSKQVPKQLHHNKTVKTDKNDINKEEADESAIPDIDFISLVIEKYQNTFTNNVIPPTTLSRERKAAGALMALWKQLNPDLNTDELLASLQAHFEKCKNIQDKWCQRKMCMNFMVTNYTEINNILTSPPKQQNGKVYQQSEMDYSKKV